MIAATLALADVKVCPDCAALLANDDTSALCTCGGEHDGQHAADCPAGVLRERVRRIAAAGVFPSETVVTCDGEADHVTFSRSRCDTCGSTDAGERCPGAVLVSTVSTLPSRAAVPDIPSIAVSSWATGATQGPGTLDILTPSTRGWRSAHRDLAARLLGPAARRRTAVVDVRHGTAWTGWYLP